jgi:predicted nucleic acid-binding protein
MTLADTSVFVEFFRGNPVVRDFGALIENDEIVLHPLVELELVLGGLSRQAEDLLSALPRCQEIDADTLKRFIRRESLVNKGIGYVDCQLLASARAFEHRLHTLDKHLLKVATSVLP